MKAPLAIMVPQLVLPRKMRKEVFTQLHSTPTAGHIGVNKTSDWIRERFYWPCYLQDIKYWCQTFDLCASRRGPSRKQRAPMHVAAPSERIALDVLSLLPTSESGNKYMLLIADYFTKWPEAYLLPNHNLQTQPTMRHQVKNHLLEVPTVQKNLNKTIQNKQNYVKACDKRELLKYFKRKCAVSWGKTPLRRRQCNGKIAMFGNRDMSPLTHVKQRLYSIPN